MPRILITGALGQIGTELVPFLRERYGQENVIATDIREPTEIKDIKPYKQLDILDFQKFENLINKYDIDWLIHNVSILSAKGEQRPIIALKVNNKGTENALELAREYNLRVFIPSSIAAFGPSTPKNKTPDTTVMRPTTMYGITKVHLELLGEYYNHRFDVDFRSLRYPGIISSKSLPGGGTTDYAVEIFYSALKEKKYTSFLKSDTYLPMMYMPDCIKGTHQLLSADNSKLTQRVYNITAVSFSPEELYNSIKKIVPDFTIKYKPDYRQTIAESWPESINDSKARNDWKWTPDYDLDSISKDMINELKKRLE